MVGRMAAGGNRRREGRDAAVCLAGRGASKKAIVREAAFSINSRVWTARDKERMAGHLSLCFQALRLASEGDNAMRLGLPLLTRPALGWALILALVPLAPTYFQAAAQPSTSEKTAAGIAAFQRGDFAKSRPLLQRACDGNDAIACAALGLMVASGQGGPTDLPKARNLFERACNGNAGGGACSTFGNMLMQGQGGPADLPKARITFQRACDSDDLDGCISLGAMLAQGQGGPANAPGARSVFERTCAADNPKGCVLLGAMLYDGSGGPPDLSRARSLYRRACDGGEMVGCLHLGYMLADGDGGPSDLPGARTLLQRVCNYGIPEGCEEAKRLSQ